MFTDKITLAIAEAAKKCMDEELKGNQHKIDANKNGKVDAQDFKLLRKQKGVSEELKGNQHKIDANKNGKIDAQDFKLLRKEETVNEEHGYVAFSHDGRKADIYANSSYEAHRKAIKHFDAPKAKHHMVHVHLAKKDGKDVVHTATESVQEAAIDDLKDRQAAAREANPYGTSAKKEDPTKRTVQGHQYGGTKQKDEKEVDESVDMGQADRTLRTKNSATNNTYHVKDKANKIVSTHDNHASAMRGAMKDMDNYRVVKEESEQLDELSKGTLANYINKASTDRVMKTHDQHIFRNEAEKLQKKSRQRAAGISQAVGKLTKEEVEELDESKAHIEQHLADRDINAKVTGNVVKVHSSDIASAKKHVAMAGYKDHKVVGGLNEEKMSDEDMAQREKIVKGMKKNLKGFKQRYGERAKEVMYATATKQAMKEETEHLIESEKKLAKLASDIEKREGLLALAAEKRKMRKGSARHYQSPAEMKHATKISDLRQQHYDLKKSMSTMSEEEQLDELSTNTLDNYRTKANKSGYSSKTTQQKLDNRSKGQNLAWSKTMPPENDITNPNKAKVKAGDYKFNKEEVTNDGFKAELEDNKAKAAGTKKQPDVSKAAVQSVKQESFSEKLSVLKEGVRSFLKGRNNG